MNWDERAKEATRGRVYQLRGESWAFIEGSHWQRDQRRTDEAVERVARELYIRDFIDREKGERRWAKLGDGKRYHLQHARAAITALIGEEP